MNTTIYADDGNLYSVSMVWLRDWCCLSFDHGEVEVLVAVDGGHHHRAITGVPVRLGSPLIGVRVFPDCNGTMRTWKAYQARPKYQRHREQGFPRRLLPSDVRPVANPIGAMLWANGSDCRKALGHKESRPAANNLPGADEVCGRIPPRAESIPEAVV